MAFDRVVIEVTTGQSPDITNPLRRNALRGSLKTIQQQSAEWRAMDIAVATHRDSTHIFRTARDHDVASSAGDFAGRYMDCSLRRSTFPIDRHAWDSHWPARTQQSGSRDVATLLTDLSYTAEHDIVDQVNIDTGTGGEG
jgi:hypothetical protein